MIDPNATCCANCQYFLLGDDFLTVDDSEANRLKPFYGDSEGECHRKSPRPGPVDNKKFNGKTLRNFGEWVKVMASDWCGEFEPRREGVIKL